MQFDSYEDFTRKCHEFLDALPPTQYSNGLPCGYYCGFRGWDLYNCFFQGNFTILDTVLDCGAWQTFSALIIANQVKKLHATDSFYWAQREFASAEDYPSPQEWIDTIESLSKHHNLKAFKQDIMNMAVAENYYDKITCISTIEHVLDDHLGLNQLYKALKPKSILLLSTEFHETEGKEYSESDGSWYRVYNRKTWDELLSPYHVVYEEIAPWSGPHYFTTAFASIMKPEVR